MLQEAWCRRPCWQDISASDRASLVDSITRTATQLQLSSDVLFLGVACLDRVLSLRIIAPEQLDTAALACLWIAAKFEHCVVPPAVHFLAAAQADFTSPAARRLLVDMEAVILRVSCCCCTPPR
jgi:cyclin A